MVAPYANAFKALAIGAKIHPNPINAIKYSNSKAHKCFARYSTDFTYFLIFFEEGF